MVATEDTEITERISRLSDRAARKKCVRIVSEGPASTVVVGPFCARTEVAVAGDAQEFVTPHVRVALEQLPIIAMR
jgi:hypothetical protein